MSQAVCIVRGHGQQRLFVETLNFENLYTPPKNQKITKQRCPVPLATLPIISKNYVNITSLHPTFYHLNNYYTVSLKKDRLNCVLKCDLVDIFFKLSRCTPILNCFLVYNQSIQLQNLTSFVNFNFKLLTGIYNKQLRGKFLCF